MKFEKRAFKIFGVFFGKHVAFKIFGIFYATSSSFFKIYSRCCHITLVTSTLKLRHMTL